MGVGSLNGGECVEGRGGSHSQLGLYKGLDFGEGAERDWVGGSKASGTGMFPLLASGLPCPLRS